MAAVTSAMAAEAGVVGTTAKFYGLTYSFAMAPWTQALGFVRAPCDFEIQNSA